MASASGRREESLFERLVNQVGNWAQACQSIRWFTDGERRYGQELWKLASVWLDRHSWPVIYDIRKAWREGLEVAMKVKGSQACPELSRRGKARREWVKLEHPWTAISAESEVHANHGEAHNAALRRRCSAFRRRQNLYAKTPSGLERALSVQRLIHNWVRLRWSSSRTPAMELGFASRAVSVGQMLSLRSFRDLPPQVASTGAFIGETWASCRCVR